MFPSHDLNAVEGDDPCQVTVDEWIDAYNLYRKANGIDVSTIKRDNIAFRLMRKVLQPYYIADITVDRMLHMRKIWKTWKTGSPGRNRNICALKAALRWAEKRYCLKKQDWTEVKKEDEQGSLRNRTRGEFYLTTNELERLLSTASLFWQMAIMLGARVGLRPGEIRHASWSWVDFASKTITIKPVECDCHTCKEKGSGLWKPKNGNAQRTISLGDDVVIFMVDFLNRKTGSKSPFILAQDNQKALEEDQLTINIQHLMEIAKVKREGFCPYTLRHTYASHMLQGGMPIAKLAALMGHSSTSITELYGHLAPGNEHDAVNAALPALNF